MTSPRRSKNNYKNDNSDKIRKILMVGVPVALLAIGLGTYGHKSTYYADRFLPNTEINNVDVSQMTVAEANEKLKKSHTENPFVIQVDDQDWRSVAPEDFGWSSDFTGALKKEQEDQNNWSWGIRNLSSAKNEKLDGVTLDENKMNETIQTLKNELNTVNEPRTPSQDATIAWDNNKFAITPEVQGNQINVDEAGKAIEKAVKEGTTKINVTDYTIKPTITKDDPKLKTEIKEMNKISDVNGKYKINGQTIDIPKDQIRQWLVYTDGKLTLDQGQVVNYLTELGNQVNTSTQPTTFKSTRRGEVQVPAGTYSWSIQPEAEAAELTNAILAGKDFERTPITQGSASADKPLIGNTYVEVDLQNQHMWVYKDGNVAIETDIVSGKPSSPTPPGVNYVWNKETNTTLRGTNDDGSKYASPVSYWMPVDWIGVGIHDSPWQPTYGGSWWLTGGSHGCVNTPPGVMAQVFSIVDVGTPVLIF